MNPTSKDYNVNCIDLCYRPMFNTRHDVVIFKLPVSKDYAVNYSVAEALYHIASREVPGVSSKIEAIKVLRAFSELGLKESKDVVEYILAHFNRITIE